jgi:hypothetical protein
VPTLTGRVYTAAGANLTVPSRLLRISYEDGHDHPDGERYEAGITAIRDKLLSSRSGRASRQTLITNTLGTVRLAQPGEARNRHPRSRRGPRAPQGRQCGRRIAR